MKTEHRPPFEPTPALDSAGCGSPCGEPCTFKLARVRLLEDEIGPLFGRLRTTDGGRRRGVRFGAWARGSRSGKCVSAGLAVEAGILPTEITPAQVDTSNIAKSTDRA